MRTVLMIAYYFPPCSCYATAAERARGFARYLPAAGWKPIVLTREPGSNGCRCSEQTLSNREEMQIEHVEVRPSALVKARAVLAEGELPLVVRRFASLPRRALTAGIILTDRPDTWAKAALDRARQLLRVGDIDAIWTTIGPYTSLSIGVRLHRESGIPWIVDLRDAASRLPRTRQRTTLFSYLKRRYFIRLASGATEVVAVTPQERDRDAGWLNRSIHVVPSGFDAAEWDLIHSRIGASGERLSSRAITYTGKIGPDYRFDVFFKGLKTLLEDDPPPTPVHVNYFGSDGAKFRAAASLLGLSDLITDHGRVAPAEAREAMIRSNVLLLLHPSQVGSGVPGGKLYEYVGARRPILAVPGTDDYIRDVITQTGQGGWAETPEQVASELRRLLKAGGTQAHAPGELSWERRAETLATILDQAAAGKPTAVIR